MKTSNSRHETRDGVLIAIASDMVARTSMSQEGFAERLNVELHRLAEARCKQREYPDLKALEKTASHTDYARIWKNWSKRVERWMDHEVEIPAWVEEAWIAALEQPWRDRAMIELASRYGLLAVRPVGAGSMDALQAFAGISTSFGHVANIGGHVFADGVFNHKDAHHADDFESFCRALAAHAIAMADQAAAIKQTAH